jgi:hypothetical protein
MDTIEMKDLIIVFIGTILACMINSYNALCVLFYEQTRLIVLIIAAVIMVIIFFMCRINIHVKKAARQ